MGSRYNDDRGRKGSSYQQRHSRSRSRSRSSTSSDDRESYSKSKSTQHHHSSSREYDYRTERSNRHDDSHRHSSRGSSSSRNSHTNGTEDQRQRQYRSDDSADDDVKLPPPPPPRISKPSLTISKPAAIAKPVQLKLATPKPAETVKKLTVASAFSNNDSDDEVEEMPAECRMRMRNIGRDTPTSSGPNSYGKTKQGFCDAKKIFEKQLRDFHE